MVHDVGELVGEQPDVQGVAHPTGVGGCPVELVVADVVPRKGGNSVAGFDIEARQSGRQPADPIVGCGVRRPGDAEIMLDRDDRPSRMNPNGAVVEGREEQREVIHHVWHPRPLALAQASPSPSSSCRLRSKSFWVIRPSLRRAENRSSCEASSMAA